MGRNLTPLIALGALAVLPVHAAPLLQLPVACVPGDSCWVVNYVDEDPGTGARDYTCGFQTYDGHNGTDIGVRNRAAMKAGVPVLAAASGTIKALRDGVRDREEDEPVDDDAGRECGNGVVIDHGGGWVSQYCHMRRGSVRVRRGARVAAGDILGMVGMSGRAEFPHLHFELRAAGRRVDPFTAEPAGGGCGAPHATLWDAKAAAALAYRPAAIFDMGIAGTPPSPRDVYLGDVEPAVGTSPALVLWGALYGVRASDRISLELAAPDGRPLARTERIAEGTKARYFLYVGRRRSGERWPPGEYRGTVVLARRQPDGRTFSVSRTAMLRVD